ncbi:HlyD family efflux transporter periplasmic adaptor subunit [Porphyrobacter sp. SLTP]|jgi:adhesin transport system membrane fusion protein|nr:HlyD family efflux transporter periplasmic adaptor subunit [Porphyrobacter sp. SLTP]
MLQRFRLSHTIVLTIGLLIIASITWARWAELDQITRAPGTVIPIGRVQIVQSVNGGEIARINVREGDQVRRGQVLVVLSKVREAAAVEEAQGKVAALLSQRTRIDAELFDKALVFPAEALAYSDFVRNQTQLYQRRREALAAELSSLAEMKALLKQELDLNLPLLKTGDVARVEVIRMERSIVDVEGQMSSIRQRYIQELQTELARTEEELVTAQQVLAQRNDALKVTELVAPTDGIVKNVRLTTVGGVLRPGDEVLQIVPTGEMLVVEAKVPPRDIAFVKAGQSASIKFDAYDYSTYGPASGRVTYISPDTLTEEGADGKQEVYYRVSLEVDVSGMRPKEAGEKIIIQPGMTIVAEIKTGKNTVFDYLTKPITKTFSESLQEK